MRQRNGAAGRSKAFCLFAGRGGEVRQHIGAAGRSEAFCRSQAGRDEVRQRNGAARKSKGCCPIVLEGSVVMFARKQGPQARGMARRAPQASDVRTYQKGGPRPLVVYAKSDPGVKRGPRTWETWEGPI